MFDCRAYRVKTGNSLASIALLFQTTVGRGSRTARARRARARGMRAAVQPQACFTPNCSSFHLQVNSLVAVNPELVRWLA